MSDKVKKGGYRFMKENSWKEVIKHLSYFHVTLDVLFVALNQLILHMLKSDKYLSDCQVSEDFIVEVDILFHFYWSFLRIIIILNKCLAR